jgi:hypothetical protein
VFFRQAPAGLPRTGAPSGVATALRPAVGGGAALVATGLAGLAGRALRRRG